ncbi:Cna B-type domain-containing protein [Limosilactobacillus sp.]|uniref:Cna B-type domain-containing protein n=1 Tax=Limosilactobacillus sp. TaxID=2773925 RepID=UPI003F10F546
MLKIVKRNQPIRMLLALILMFIAFFLATPAKAAGANDAPVVAQVPASAATTNQSVDQASPVSSTAPGQTEGATTSTTPANNPAGPGNTTSPTDSQGDDQGNQLTATKVDLHVTVNGQPLSDNTTIDQFTPFNINFGFDFSGQDVKNGDYFDFTLPSGLRVPDEQFPVVDQSTGTVIANVTVNSADNTGRVVFNSVGSDAKGAFNIQMNVDTTKVPANKETPINISVNGENKLAGSFIYTPGTVKPDEVFSKYSYNDTLGPDKSNPNDTNPSYYTPDDITHGNLTYALRINPGARRGINGTTINDQLTTPGYRYDPDSFLVYRTTWTYANGNWSNGSLEYDGSIRPVIASDGRSFTLDFGDAVDGQGFVVFYRLLAYDANGKKWVPVNQLPVAEQPANGTIIGNNAVLKSTNNEPVYYNQTMQIHSSNGSGSISNFNIQGTKTWNDGNNAAGQRPTSITIDLYADDNPTPIRTVTTDASQNWEYVFTNLRRYREGETGAQIRYRVVEEPVANYVTTYNGYNTVNTYVAPVNVKKVWNDDHNHDGARPTSITVDLYQNNVKTNQQLVLNNSNNWQGSLADLPVYDIYGNKISYTWREANVPTGYTARYDDQTNTITNTYTPAKPTTTSVAVNKIWADDNNQDGLRPGSVTVELLADGQATGQTVTLDATNNWAASFDNLAVTKNGQAIVYTVQEKAVNGYTSTVSGDAEHGFTITNTHTPATVDKAVNKVWVDGNNQDGLRPGSVTVELLADGQATGQTVTLNAGNNWRGGLSGLAEYANGKKITYTWREANVPTGYTATVDGDTITNTHTPATVDKAVNKVWVDGNNQDGLRPDSVTVELLADGQATGQTVTLNAGNNWRGGLSGLAEYANGKEVTYTWREVNVPTGYTATVDGDTITNAHTPATITKMVTKQWIDGNNQDGLRPASIMVNLLANGKVVKTVELSAQNNWTAFITNLAQFADGQLVDYEWQEVNIPNGYQSRVNGDTITNTHVPAVTTVNVKKVWNDANNQDGLRPTTITVQLLANGQVVAETQLSAANDWTASFSKLPVNSRGQVISYTVKEVNVPSGYQSVVTRDGDNLVITNTHVPSVPGKPDTPSVPATPGQPGQPFVPGQPVTPSRPVVPQHNQPQPEKTSGELPQTGNSDPLAILGLGILLGEMALGLAVKRS